MSPEKEQAIFQRWPDWFRTAHDVRLSGMSDGFRCDDGWYDIIYELFERLEPLVAKLDESGPSFEVRQVKEKFGTLRFYVNRRNDEIEAAIDSALERASRTCELCGNPGNLEERLWKTLCSSCMPSHIIAIFEVAFRRSRRITDDELRRDQLSCFREKLWEASEWLPERDRERLLKAYADSFTDADYRPLALCHDVPELLAAIRATPVGKLLTVEYQRVGDHPQKLTRMETELQDICMGAAIGFQQSVHLCPLLHQEQAHE